MSIEPWKKVRNICRNSDGVSNAGKKLNISALGGCGVALLIVYLPDIISGKKLLIDNAMITESASALLISILILVIILVISGINAMNTMKRKSKRNWYKKSFRSYKIRYIESIYYKRNDDIFYCFNCSYYFRLLDSTFNTNVS